ncbi:MAG TPA: hypothetical protein ENG78_03140 [Acidiferrobacteraceae bacterium]|nr:hypothetical protein [Acidiferrobacteraceae bacterium]HEX19799.1 hypothetical protein [Acidiferrobacteraceae bacterium]
MSTLSSSIGIFGSALLILCLWVRILPWRIKIPAWRGLVFLAGAIILLIPFGELSIAAKLRGLVGDLSMTSLLAMVLISLSYITGRDYFNRYNRYVLLLSVLCAALFLYPMTMGLTFFDPYLMGYGSYGFAAVVFLGALISWAIRAYVTAAALLLAMVAYSVGLYESRNLWDYLIDPVIAIYAAFWLASTVFRNLYQRLRISMKQADA